MKKVPLFPILVTTNSPKKQQIIKQGKIQNGPVHAQNIYIYIYRFDYIQMQGLNKAILI
jgi:hypothetical protein